MALILYATNEILHSAEHVINHLRISIHHEWIMKQKRENSLSLKEPHYFEQSAMLTLLLNRKYGVRRTHFCSMFAVGVYIGCMQHRRLTFIIMLTGFSEMFFFTKEKPFYLHSKLINIKHMCLCVFEVLCISYDNFPMIVIFMQSVY